MTSPVEPHHSPKLDLELLEADSSPTFIIKTGSKALDFDILFCNEAFRTSRFRSSVIADDRAALLFRSWAQALGDFKPRYKFADRLWSAELAGTTGVWKLVRVVEVVVSRDQDPEIDKCAKQAGGDDDTSLTNGRSPIYRRTRTELMQDPTQNRTVMFRTIPRTNLSARWESIQTMMEMSDVGVFEYNTEGKLLHANEAWYRLRYERL